MSSSSHGRAGHGRGCDNRWNQLRASKSSKPPDMRFTQANPNNPNAPTFATVKDHIVQKVQKNFRHGRDIAGSLDVLELVDLAPYKPERELSTKPDADARKLDQEGLDMLYKVQI